MQQPVNAQRKVPDYTGAGGTANGNPNGGVVTALSLVEQIHQKEQVQVVHGLQLTQPHSMTMVTTVTLHLHGTSFVVMSFQVLVDSEDGRDSSDGSKCPGDGTSPLSERILSRCKTTRDMVALMGNARNGDGSEALLDSTMANALNTFWGKTTVGEEVAQAGDFTVEAFCDGMSADASGIANLVGQFDSTEQKLHEFNDIQPIVNARPNDVAGGPDVGGYAQIVHADGSVQKHFDVAGAGDDSDGFIGAYKNAGGSGYTINASAWNSGSWQDLAETARWCQSASWWWSN